MSLDNIVEHIHLISSNFIHRQFSFSAQILVLRSHYQQLWEAELARLSAGVAMDHRWL